METKGREIGVGVKSLFCRLEFIIIADGSGGGGGGGQT